MSRRVRLGDRDLCYLRGEMLPRAERIALKVMGRAFEWTDAAREDFAENPPDMMEVEVTIIGSRKKRSVSVFEYRKSVPVEGHGTP
jgi:hypothetical protein